MIFERVKAIILDHLHVDAGAVTMQSHLKNDLGADSLDLLDILMDVEEAFVVNIPEKQIGFVVGDLVRYIQKERPENNQEQVHQEVAAAS